MRALDDLQYDSVWDAFEAKFRFRPSVSAFPGIDEPADSITFRFADSYDDVLLDELKASIFGALQSCNAFASEVYYLDWQHESYQIHVPAVDEKWANGFPDGDYAIFLAKQMSLGTFGHPWEFSICLFGDQFVRQMLQNKPRILGTVLRDAGGYLTKRDLNDGG